MLDAVAFRRYRGGHWKEAAPLSRPAAVASAVDWQAEGTPRSHKSSATTATAARGLLGARQHRPCVQVRLGHVTGRLGAMGRKAVGHWKPLANALAHAERAASVRQARRLAGGMRDSLGALKLQQS